MTSRVRREKNWGKLEKHEEPLFSKCKWHPKIDNKRQFGRIGQNISIGK